MMIYTYIFFLYLRKETDIVKQTLRQNTYINVYHILKS